MEQEKAISYSCFRCGSRNVGKPFNNTGIELKCFDCGHARPLLHKKWRDIAIAGGVDGLKEKRAF